MTDPQAPSQAGHGESLRAALRTLEAKLKDGLGLSDRRSKELVALIDAIATSLDKFIEVYMRDHQALRERVEALEEAIGRWKRLTDL